MNVTAGNQMLFNLSLQSCVFWQCVVRSVMSGKNEHFVFGSAAHYGKTQKYFSELCNFGLRQDCGKCGIKKPGVAHQKMRIAVRKLSACQQSAFPESLEHGVTGNICFSGNVYCNYMLVRTQYAFPYIFFGETRLYRTG